MQHPLQENSKSGCSVISFKDHLISLNIIHTDSHSFEDQLFRCLAGEIFNLTQIGFLFNFSDGDT